MEIFTGLHPLFLMGFLLLVGMVGGQLAQRCGLPKVTGFVLVGMLFSPSCFNLLPSDFSSATEALTNFALAVVTYLIGGSLEWRKLRKLGKVILSITFLEAEGAFVLVLFGLLLVLPIFGLHGLPRDLITVYLPASLALATLACATDPTPTIAVIHEEKESSDFASSILAVAASDDALCIVNFSLFGTLAVALGSGARVSASLLIGSFGSAVLKFVCTIILGVAAGVVLVIISRKISVIGTLLTLIIGLLLLVFGVADYLGLDSLLATMLVGVVAVNMQGHTRMFDALEKYFEELIVTAFFVLAGAQLVLGSLLKALPLVVAFVFLRAGGKWLGAFIGASVSGAPPGYKKYLAFGLLPQGGIIVGLALVLTHEGQMDELGRLILNVILGTTVLLELLGPPLTKWAIAQNRKEEGH